MNIILIIGYGGSFNLNDIKRLRKIHPIVKPFFPEIINVLIKRIGANPKLVEVMETHQLSVETAQAVFEEWLSYMFTCRYDSTFVERIFKVATVHERVGINPKYITMTMGIFLLSIDYVMSKVISEPEMMYSFSQSFTKVMMINLILMTQSYEEVKRQKILLSMKHI